VKSLRLLYALYPLLLALMAGCASHPQPSGSANASAGGAAADAPKVMTLPPDAKGIRTLTIRSARVADFLEIPARIQADPTLVVRVFPPVGGRLVAVNVKPGDRVRKGQALAELQSADAVAARSEFLKARTETDLKRKALERSGELYGHGALSLREFQQAQADAQTAEAGLRRAETTLNVLGISPEASSDRFTVFAPRDGVVMEIGGAAGEFSKSLDSPAPVCTLADLSHVWALGDVYEKDLAGLAVGAPAEVRVSAYPEKTWNERVAAFSGGLDPATRTLKVRVQIANSDARLKPEMFAAIRLLRPERDVILVPAEAVLREGAAAYLFVERQPRQFERRVIQPGPAHDGQVEVLSGLKAGEVIVTEGALLLRAPAS